MDISSKKLPIILIALLLVILVVQYFSNDTSNSRFIDSETCEIWVKDKFSNEPQYLGEYDPKCMDLKNLHP